MEENRVLWKLGLFSYLHYLRKSFSFWSELTIPTTGSSAQLLTGGTGKFKRLLNLDVT
jgi:hypothetical protein